jgi:hypothetical protein
MNGEKLLLVIDNILDAIKMIANEAYEMDSREYNVFMIPTRSLNEASKLLTELKEESDKDLK